MRKLPKELVWEDDKDMTGLVGGSLKEQGQKGGSQIPWPSGKGDYTQTSRVTGQRTWSRACDKTQTLKRFRYGQVCDWAGRTRLAWVLHLPGHSLLWAAMGSGQLGPGGRLSTLSQDALC